MSGNPRTYITCTPGNNQSKRLPTTNHSKITMSFNSSPVKWSLLWPSGSTLAAQLFRISWVDMCSIEHSPFVTDFIVTWTQMESSLSIDSILDDAFAIHQCANHRLSIGFSLIATCPEFLNNLRRILHRHQICQKTNLDLQVISFRESSHQSMFPALKQL